MNNNQDLKSFGNLDLMQRKNDSGYRFWVPLNYQLTARTKVRHSLQLRVVIEQQLLFQTNAQRVKKN